ncbi:hypothetical protein GpartN1_g1805.t1 [Galdieria partita]|uniref:Nucleotide-diphospho-sugar transferase domain-containing protein n=1 Tax=Galdieria partita TaxID=83374 RepID=A0A9C7UNK5_9RHOD|nr:hypothetical protein GpartN1_g1805.t1 [Galdieria partita]
MWRITCQPRKLQTLLSLLCLIIVMGFFTRSFFPSFEVTSYPYSRPSLGPIALLSAISSLKGKYDLEVLKLSLSNKIAYSKHHNYDFFVCNCTVDENWHAMWGKVLALEAILAKGYRWVIFLDLDLLITNFDTRLEEFFLEESFDIIIGVDCNGINDGVVMFRGTESNIQLLRSLWTFTEYSNEYYHEQTALWRTISRNRTIAKRTLLIPPGILQSYQDDSCGSKFGGEDFIIHFPGDFTSRKLANEMKKYMNFATFKDTIEIPKIEGKGCNCKLQE